MRTGICGLILVVALLTMSTVLVWAQGNIELQFDDQPLGVAMRALGQAYGVQYSVPTDMANKRVTVHQTVDSVAAAVQALAKAADVRAMQDPNTGSFMFQAKTAAGTGAGTGTSFGAGATRNPWATAPTGTVPTPYRAGQPGIQPAVPGGATPGGAPGTAGATGAGMFTTPFGTQLDIKDLTLRVLETTYLNPELASIIFGGQAIYDISSTSSGGGYGGGGTGNNTYGNNNSGIGNNNGLNSNSGIGNNRNSNIGSGLNSNRTY